MDDGRDSGCAESAGRVSPVIDRHRCEGKGDCERECPYRVFSVQKLTDGDRAALTLMGRLKAWAHGGRQAYVVKPQACHACRRCVEICPEQAIRLAPLAT